MLHVPESGILAEMYGNHDRVLCSADICPHEGTGYPVCYSCSETACSSAFHDTGERGNAGKRHAGGHLGSARSLIQVQNGNAAPVS